MSGELGGGAEIGVGGELPGAGSETGPTIELGGESSPVEPSDIGFDAAVSEAIVEPSEFDFAVATSEPTIEADGFDAFDGNPIEPGADGDFEDTQLPEASLEPSFEGGPEQPSDTGTEASLEPEADVKTLEEIAQDATAEIVTEAQPPEAAAEQSETASEVLALDARTPEAGELPADPVEPPETSVTETQAGETSKLSDSLDAPTTELDESAQEPVEPPETSASETQPGETSERSDAVDAPTTEVNEPAQEPVEPAETGASQMGPGESAQDPVEPSEARATEPAETTAKGRGEQEPVEAKPGERVEPAEANKESSEQLQAEVTEPAEKPAPASKEEEFAAMKAEAQKTAIESVDKEQVLDALDKLDKNLPVTVEPREPDPRHVRGFLGEEGAAQQAQREGEMIVVTKKNFSDTTRGGMDTVSLRAGKDGPILVEGDNKVQNTKDTVYSVTSLVQNQAKNEAAVLAKAQELQKSGTLKADQLVGGATEEAIQAGRISKEVTNVGAMGIGAQGLSDKLAQSDVKLNDMASRIAEAAKNAQVVAEKIELPEDI